MYILVSHCRQRKIICGCRPSAPFVFLWENFLFLLLGLLFNFKNIRKSFCFFLLCWSNDLAGGGQHSRRRHFPHTARRVPSGSEWLSYRLLELIRILVGEGETSHAHFVQGFILLGDYHVAQILVQSAGDFLFHSESALLTFRRFEILTGPPSVPTGQNEIHDLALFFLYLLFLVC